MNWSFLCADCYQTFEAKADDEYDRQECPECGKECTPLFPEETQSDDLD